MFALVDCNNFYASCEKIFNPKLKNEAVVVLSNNDGCVIARSKEAKKLDIKMGAPIFEYKELIKKKIIHIFSSNFTLYGNMSQRVMKTLESFLFPMEIYSIDEAFLDLYSANLTGKRDLLNLANNIKEKVYKWTGVEVSVGIAKTKTLAKVAAHIAKKNRGYFVLTEKNDIENILKKTALDDIWGIGHRLKKRLYKLGVYSGYDLAMKDSSYIQKYLSVNVHKTALELNQIKCFESEKTPPSKQSICSSRSFAKKIENLEDLEKAISSFISIAAKKLRNQKMHTNFISVFITTSFHSKDPFYSNSCQIILSNPTSYTPDLITYAKKGLKKIFKKDFLYKKAGIILSDFTDETFSQRDFFSKLNEKNKDVLMKVIDKINLKADKKAVFFAAERIDTKYKSSSQMRSFKYTTSWDELLSVK
ncbi:MAG: DNA polymerase IV 1 [Candidatus Anoxychlamydiales bacterium]|nr:DNA polymerase IV 1 [Candidatus Anoxychlamydiales bacterium]HEU64444.1 Y-family DNA polymerase [Chlamydiota bacterium]